MCERSPSRWQEGDGEEGDGEEGDEESDGEEGDGEGSGSSSPDPLRY